MLAELTIRSFAVIRDTRIEFGPGMNALTGETGAGKSIVLDALGAVLGERTSADMVRTGEERAYIEAIFDICDHPHAVQVSALLSEFGVDWEPGEPLILSRDITAAGRSTARVNGRALTATALTMIGELLVDIHGQSDHLSLLRPAAQLALLDRYAGISGQVDEFAAKYREWRETRRRIESFDAEERERAQRLDLLRYQAEEIERIAPQQGEIEELERERSILTHAERLAASGNEARAALAGEELLDSLDSGALDRIRAAESALLDMQRFDASIEPLLTQIREALFILEEADAELRDYLERVQIDPERLATVNERLAELRSLTRKYGPSIEDVIAYLNQISEEIQALQSAQTDIDELRASERRQAEELAKLASAMSAKRKHAAERLAAEVERTIAELNMGRATFEVRFDVAASETGIEVDGRRVAVDETGIDRIAFYLAANRGEELRPLARVASGGETARLMLALKSILSGVDSTPTLVFDEIDVGVGGRSGQVVGEKLWSLTDHHQVIVISHLPQVAAFADRHTAMVKREVGERTETDALALDRDASLDEIATMFDGKPVTPESRANAEALVRRIEEWKAARSRTSEAAAASLL